MPHGRIILPPVQFVAREQLADWFEDFNDTRIWGNLTCQLLTSNTFQQKCSKYGYGAQSILLCGEYYASARGLRCTLCEEELCGRRADW